MVNTLFVNLPQSQIININEKDFYHFTAPKHYTVN